MAHLTITVDAATLTRARCRALRRGESVNAYLVQALRRYADGDQPDHGMEQVLVAAESSAQRSGTQGRRWKRAEVHR